MRRILDLGQPIVKTYPQHLNLFSILSRNDDYLDWFYSNFIQLSCPKTFPFDLGKIVNYFNYDKQYPFYGGAPFVQNYSENRSSATQIIEKLIEHIKNDRYVAVYLNDFYLPYRELAKDLYHDLLIYGFDVEKAEFYILGYDKGYPTNQSIAFSSLYEAYKSANEAISSNKLPIYMTKDWVYEPNNDITVAFNKEYVVFLLKCYLESQPFVFETEDDYVFGLNVYDLICDHLRLVLETKTSLDHRAFYILWEHKKIMRDRLIYIFNNHYALRNENLLEQSIILERQARIILNLAIRTKITSSLDKINEMIKRCKELKCTAERFTENMMSILTVA
ncbi:hypothetical protein NYE69_14805 [Paenibacillus sp. FSL R5-0527]|uniref:hypothetical protein n=1 Tax=Paenibacillus sp. FSL R5-0527 TaxID=2975321 RepID=UPI00097A6CDF|nr:hypothetical protein BK140_04435 [Paenibacillus macerans]